MVFWTRVRLPPTPYKNTAERRFFCAEEEGSRTARPRGEAPRECASGTFEPKPGLKGARGAGGTPLYSTLESPYLSGFFPFRVVI